MLAAYLLTGYSMITLSVMNYERYQGIINPLAHRVKLTKKKLSSYVFSACVVYTVIILMLFSEAKIRKIIAAICILFFLISTAYVYIRIFLAAKNTHCLQNPPNAIAGKEPTTKKKNLKEIKLAKSCFMIFLLFVFSFLPVLITTILKTEEFGSEKFTSVRPWTVTILMLNSSLNSVIFFWTRPILRKEALKIFGKTHH